MAEKIVEVFSLSSANGWWLSRKGDAKFLPVVCWGLALRYSSEYTALAPEKVIVGFASDEIDDVLGIDLDNRIYYHDSEFWKPGEELK